MTIESASEMFLMDDEVLISKEFTNMEEIYHSENSIILKARRQGQWLVLKALSEEKRNIQLYQEYQQKEYDIQSKLASPYVPQVYGLEEVEGYGRCLVMEWIDGMNLSVFRFFGKVKQYLLHHQIKWGKIDDLGERRKRQKPQLM